MYKDLEDMNEERYIGNVAVIDYEVKYGCKPHELDKFDDDEEKVTI